MTVNFKAGELVTHFTVGSQRTHYRFCRVHSVGENGLVLKDCKTDEPLRVAFDPKVTRQDFRVVVERRVNETGTRKRALELSTIAAHAQLVRKVERLRRDMASDAGFELTYPDLFYEAEPSSFRDYWLRELAVPSEPDCVDATGAQITDSLRPWAAKKN